ncbi:MAG: tryptophan synthase subunit alpha, partial [Chloroflexia bacterium]
MQPQRGIARIEAAFDAARQDERAVLVAYLTLGYPTPEDSVALIQAVVEAGADIVELGIPFSDALADGPTIQRASDTALRQGMTVARCLELATAVRARGVDVPLLFMGYYNPILSYGEVRFTCACREAGVDGLIVPDLPPEEGGALEAACASEALALVYLLAPTSTEERIRLIAQRSRGFIYLVSVTGTTGARDTLPLYLEGFVQR